MSRETDPRIVNAIAPSAAFARVALEYRGILRRVHFRAVAPDLIVGTLPMAQEIARRLRSLGRLGRGALVWFTDTTGREVVARHFQGIHPGEVYQDIEYAVATSGTAPGSDVIPDAFRPVTTEFVIQYVAPLRGGGGRRSYGARETPFFALRDYACAPGDCLLGVLRATGRAPQEASKTLRKRYGIPAGPIGLEHLGALARAFCVNARVFSDCEPAIERIFDDRSRNRCEARAKPVELFRCDGDPLWPVVDILLENAGEKGAHYSHIVGFKPVQLCPVTGDLLLRKTPAALRKRVLEQGRVWLGTREAGAKKPLKKRVLVYDFETVWDPEDFNRIVPYSVAWYDFDPEEPPCFAEEEDRVKISYTREGPFGSCAYDLLQYIDAADPDTAYLLVSFNGSRFDHFILAEAADAREELSNIFWSNGSLRELRLGRHRTLDLCRLVPGQSLAKTCAGFVTSPQKLAGFDHSLPQRAFLERGAGGLKAWLAENGELASHYVATDVLCTCDLAVKLGRAIEALVGFNPVTKGVGTIGEVAWKALCSTAAIPAAAQSEELDRFFREAIVGGRTQNFRPRGLSATGAFRMVDVKSLYPTVMAAENSRLFDPRLMYGQFPVGPPIPTGHYVEGRLGFYEARVVRQPAMNVLPMRPPDGGPLRWTWREPFACKTSSCEIELIRKHGGEVEVGRGYYWEETSRDLFERFLQPLFAEKDRQDALKTAKDPAYNPALREVCKLLMNSCSGKLAQRNFEDLVVLAKGSAAQLAAEKKMRGGRADEWYPLRGNTCILVGKKQHTAVYKPRRAKPSQLAAFIYAHARTYMYELLISRHDVLYMDTDSALLSREDYEAFRRDFPMLDALQEGRPWHLGDLEEELGEPEEARVILLAPKMYLVLPTKPNPDKSKKGQKKEKVKGVCLERDRLLVAPLSPDEMHAAALHKIYGTENEKTVSLAASALPLFERLFDNGHAEVLCSQIARGFRDGGLALHQRYLVKRLEVLRPRETEDERKVQTAGSGVDIELTYDEIIRLFGLGPDPACPLQLERAPPGQRA